MLQQEACEEIYQIDSNVKLTVFDEVVIHQKVLDDYPALIRAYRVFTLQQLFSM